MGHTVVRCTSALTKPNINHHHSIVHGRGHDPVFEIVVCFYFENLRLTLTFIRNGTILTLTLGDLAKTWVYAWNLHISITL